jgi:hypothetical protein
MNDSADYLMHILERFVRERVLYDQKRLKKKRWRGDQFIEGHLSGHYLVIGKLLNTLESMGIFEALPVSLQQHITPSSLVEDMKRKKFANLRLLDDAFMQTVEEVVYQPVNLRVLFEELITEGILLQGKQGEFDEGQLFAYSFCLLSLYNQAEVSVRDLFYALPKKLRKFIPEQLKYIKKSDVGL